MRLFAITFALVFSFGIYSQPAAEVKEGKTHDAKAVLETESKLDQKVTELNKRLTEHTKIFRQKLKAIPAKTIDFKGKADGDNCKESKDQTADDNDCIKLEVFDFQDSEWGKSDLGFGSRAKQMTLFYVGASTGKDDPMKEPARELKKIVFSSKNVNFKENETHFTYIDDSAPKEENKEAKTDLGGTHDEKVIIYYQNGFPTLNMEPFTKEENVNEKGVGKYKLKNVENSKTNDIRNNFKKIFFVKNLDYFDKIFTSVEDTNERYALKKYKESNGFLKSSLKY